MRGDSLVDLGSVMIRSELVIAHAMEVQVLILGV